MTSKPRCYVASPLGFSVATKYYYDNVYLPTLAELVTIVDPWQLTTDQEFIDADREGRNEEFTHEVGVRNIKAIDSSELMIAHLDGQEVDSGTVAEIGYGTASMPVFGLRQDVRESGEKGSPVNLQVATFIRISGGTVTRTLEDLVADVSAFLNK